MLVILILILIAAAAFFVGFLQGSLMQPTVSRKKESFSRYEDETTRKEYENFLNYDGTEQS